MSKQEGMVLKNTRQKQIQQAILGTVAAAGLLSVAMFAPNVLSAFGKLGILPHRRQKESINRSRTRLIQKGLLVKDERGFLKLTSRGVAELALEKLQEVVLKKPKKWDKKWRVLVFDIPEKYRKSRDHARGLLVSKGFVRLQDSVWTYPYPCEDFVTLLKTDLKLGRSLLYLIVDSLENDRFLREEFQLPPQ